MPDDSAPLDHSLDASPPDLLALPHEAALTDSESPAVVDPYPTLLPRQQRFVTEYLRDLKPGPAAIRAGYAPDYASIDANNRLLKNPNIALAIEIRKADLSARAGLPRDAWLAELADIAMLKPESAKAWIDAGVKVSVRDKLVGAQTFGKALGWLDDKRPSDGGRQLIFANVQINQPRVLSTATNAELGSSEPVASMLQNVTPKPPKLSA